MVLSGHLSNPPEPLKELLTRLGQGSSMARRARNPEDPESAGVMR
jgi:hypothetical protein